MSNLLAICAIVSAFLLTAGPAWGRQAASDSASSPDEKPEMEKVAVDAVADDAAIESRIERILTASNWFGSLEVQVDQGIVFLSGETEQAEHRQWAENVARRTEDVVAVINNMTVSDAVDLSGSLALVSRSLSELWGSFLKRLPLILAALAVIVLTWIVARIAVRLVSGMITRSRLRRGLQDLARQLTATAVWVAGLLVAAVVAFPGMTPAKLLTVLGLGSVAIGFAFKDIFENFFAGVLILWRFPFDNGDFIECGDVSGKVEDITVRMTSIRRVDGQLVVLPNAMLFKQAVYVLTNRKSRRITVVCGVAYDADVAAARDAIREAVQHCDSVDRQYDVEIFAREFADSSVNFEVTWWCGATPLDERRSRDEVIEAVKSALDEADIEIPFPYRTLTFKQPLPVQRESSDGRTPADAEDGSKTARHR